MTDSYRDALLEYVALTQLENDLRGVEDYELRNQVSGRKNLARERIEKLMRSGRR